MMHSTFALSLLCAANLLATAPLQPARAFYSQSDRTERLTILPNMTAFLLDGAARAQPGQMDSVADLNSHRVALTSVTIPHHKLWGTGGTAWYSGWDYYVPDKRLLLVDRTPVSRTWSNSSAPELSCQTKDGLRVGFGVTATFAVAERDAATYLTRFGVVSPGDPADPKVTFTTTYFATPLRTVVETLARAELESLYCREFHARELDVASGDSDAINAQVAQSARAFFGPLGVTLENLGLADGFTLDPQVRAAQNRVFVADQNAIAAAVTARFIEILKAQSVVTMTRSFADKLTGHLPTTSVFGSHQ